MELTPSREEFQKLALTDNLIAVSTEISTDLDTPVSIYYKLVGEQRALPISLRKTTVAPVAPDPYRGERCGRWAGA